MALASQWRDKPPAEEQRLIFHMAPLSGKSCFSRADPRCANRGRTDTVSPAYFPQQINQPYNVSEISKRTTSESRRLLPAPALLRTTTAFLVMDDSCKAEVHIIRETSIASVNRRRATAGEPEAEPAPAWLAPARARERERAGGSGSYCRGDIPSRRFVGKVLDSHPTLGNPMVQMLDSLPLSLSLTLSLTSQDTLTVRTGGDLASRHSHRCAISAALLSLRSSSIGVGYRCLMR
ncbi:hypothetical protein MBM_08752 [Drepanopeziza brunnea f. sp. 'multigermtubi' MB_m1]|uniref:Uncharacterized protein n=1 Tax=Marssonina brunnea f. sp. multigermtubi (strain MB_m1) TaxID=1072389 RepID=K1W7E3_MARBU|nr:uncharacterized protein MBM_08752 [Drepanopeziza brunnea f. sp. 'multigermtubi' MB_m1]EKD12990.1 hypothetical protein MBM_08752 [Drepanopeziza brunnea f. sp. 'multigermtubi' MB_m1]